MDTLEKTDLLEFRLAESELRRLKAELTLLTLEHRATKKQMEDAELAVKSKYAELKARYGLSDLDELDLKTGAIRRAPTHPT